MHSENLGWTTGLHHRRPSVHWLTGIDLIHLLGYPALFAYVAFGVSVGFFVVRLGHAVLGLLRDLDDYRANRPIRLETAPGRLTESEKSPEPRVTVARR